MSQERGPLTTMVVVSEGLFHSVAILPDVERALKPACIVSD
jgi:hypothetical protein